MRRVADKKENSKTGRKPRVKTGGGGQQPWLRSYRAKLWNPKTRRLSDALYRKWDYALCMSDANGYLPPLSDIAFHWQVSDCEAQQLINDLIEARLVDIVGGIGGERRRLRLHDWDHWQPYADTTATERKRKQRAASRDVTELSRQCHGQRSESVSASESNYQQTRRHEVDGTLSTTGVVDGGIGSCDYTCAHDDEGVL